MDYEASNLENAQDYYGNVLEDSSDLKTDACATIAAPPPAVRKALANVHDEVRARYYGCGLVFPDAVEGCHILDLGSGAGQDVYIMAQLVGEHGSVTGVDATPQQLAVQAVLFPGRLHFRFALREIGLHRKASLGKVDRALVVSHCLNAL